MRFPEGPPRFSRLEAWRLKAGELIAGPDFQHRYAQRVAEAIEFEIANAREAAIGASGFPISPQTGAIASQPGDVLAQAADNVQTAGGPARAIRELEPLQIAAWIWWHTEPTVGNILATWTALVIGNGVDVDIDPSARRTDGRNAAEAWQQFDEENNYSTDGGMVWDAVFNTFLFGEYFHWFLGPEDSQFPTQVRGLDPISIGGIREIKTDPNDLTKATNYIRRGGQYDDIPPEQINHWRLILGGNQIRGRPLIERPYDDIFRLQQSRLTTWMAQEFRMRLMTLQYIRETKNAGKLPANMAMPKPLTILEVPPGAKVEIPDLRKTVVGSGNDNTAEKLLLTTIAQGVFLPYHIVAQEFREANLASLIAAEGPTAKMAELFVSRSERSFRGDIQRVTGTHTASGKPIEMTANIRPVVIRDPHKDRESWLAVRAQREVSLRTFHEQIGLDADEERERMTVETTANAASLAAANPVNQIGNTIPAAAAAGVTEAIQDEIEAHYHQAGAPYGGGPAAALLWWQDQNGSIV